mmetsp:Transcript_3668/g.16183  ORF Transcript_3668/g.16183 Transcript_3668/m.16183 type:complete len:292 (-) Transcript_3668:345-1220(-)
MTKADKNRNEKYEEDSEILANGHVCDDNEAAGHGANGAGALSDNGGESRSDPDSKLQKLKLLQRTLLRSATYIGYDLACLLGFKHSSRVSKVVVETLVDHAVPPAARSLPVKCIEYLIPVALSSGITWILRNRHRVLNPKHALASSLRASYGRASASLVGSFAYAVLYRVLRQAVIYRLFFRFGSHEYILISVIAIIIAFFREEGWKDLFRITRWPRHISVNQGTVAVIRCLVYIAAFSIPIAEPQYKRGKRLLSNFRKLIYFASIAIFSHVWSRRTLWISPLKTLPRVLA